ncbi:MAG: tRNA pseudouridine(38-40) synthase TruA [Zetaproteobacteria bacterium CG_4_10_14_0_2_um_filter_55_20]|nr:MAG: tRNA pseudouridine(38-40) synthase TruA [Zetaproteobacteria bacterium CG1_02_55_237]PIS20502.1 MAG: tRNA pseudouridine(38-40) synthase TruA [Zetaproteobacteria bacterium CG08_land_8_20_14_0_20_55_17]PIY53315.1 MAG: tRNA pseudouridine(38-40) synthase TruA [Zetaproteobacteria bacterium CG_4_10_14_0_8_um_filter_55_43]PIZ40112.1 MAG: tRNA pseudouridine(38-40) synthase TruA [Zetaproteobacteria bacterium CG_4_10_14_0_2_um_filter_55_20]PJB82117.1 MAG: tRNA pseudouridine(38-40) synthase TruA [Z
MENNTKQRIALALEFDGRGLCGWQRQDNGPSVQQHLEEALTAIDGQPVSCIAAGRTDAGVHAEAMAVHADVQQSRFVRSPLAYLHGVNQGLPEQIRVIGVRAVAADFHARFDCRERAYRYQIWNRGTAPAIERWRHWWMPRKLDIAAMQEAGHHLMGRQDFSCFRASGCQASSPLREVREVRIVQHGHCLSIEVRADAFLYHMVRNMVGSLVRVGVGKWKPEYMAELLAGRDRLLAGETAPAHGLYFTNAVYDDFNSKGIIG